MPDASGSLPSRPLPKGDPSPGVGPKRRARKGINLLSVSSSSSSSSSSKTEKAVKSVVLPEMVAARGAAPFASSVAAGGKFGRSGPAPRSPKVSSIEQLEESELAACRETSAALSVFMDMLGIRRGSTVAPRNASAGAVARKYAAVRTAPRGQRGALSDGTAYSFGTHSTSGKELAATPNSLDETRRRLSRATRLAMARHAERESERANAKLLGASQYEGKPKLKWRAMASRAFEVSTSTGEREQMQLRVWTTAQLASSSSSSRRRRLLPSFGTTRKKPSAKTATAFFEFDLTSPQRRAFLRGWNKQGNPVFDATWKFLEDSEREFAAALYLQSWTRRVLFCSDPVRFAHLEARLVGAATSLLSALAEMSRAQLVVDDTKVPPKRRYVLETHEEEQIAELFSKTGKAHTLGVRGHASLSP